MFIPGFIVNVERAPAKLLATDNKITGIRISLFLRDISLIHIEVYIEKIRVEGSKYRGPKAHPPEGLLKLAYNKKLTNSVDINNSVSRRCFFRKVRIPKIPKINIGEKKNTHT